MGNIASLPTEILSLILEQVDQGSLCNCALVNRQFYTATSPLLWRTIILNTDVEALKIYRSLFNTPTHHLLGHHVHHLTLGCFEMIDELLSDWMPRMPQLETLAIFCAKDVTDIGFHQLTNFCPNLQSLQLHDGTITSQSIWALGQRCLQLRHLELRRMHLHSDIFTALDHCPMEKLKLVFYNPLPLESMTELLCYDLLTDLSLTRASFIRPLLVSASNHSIWPRLTHLTLEKYDNLEDVLTPFIKTHPRLQSLALIDVNLTSTTLDAIAAYLPDVIEIDFDSNHHLPTQALRRMIHQCRALANVSLYGCGQTLADFPEAGRQCIDLRPRRIPIGSQETYLHQLDQHAINNIDIRPRRIPFGSQDTYLHQLDQDAINNIRLSPL